MSWDETTESCLACGDERCSCPDEPALVSCACGREYDLAAWQLRGPARYQHVPAMNGEPAQTLELKECTCRSTISRDVTGLPHVV